MQWIFALIIIPFALAAETQTVLGEELSPEEYAETLEEHILVFEEEDEEEDENFSLKKSPDSPNNPN